jgi:hypothetical protein
MGGTMYVVSARGAGATFTVRLPAVVAGSSAAQEALATPAVDIPASDLHRLPTGRAETDSA